MSDFEKKFELISGELEAAYKSNIEKIELEYRKLTENIEKIYKKYASEYEKEPAFKDVFAIIMKELEEKAAGELEAAYKSNIEKIELEYRKLTENIEKICKKYASEYEKEKRKLETEYESTLRTEKIKMVDSYIEKVFEDALNRIAGMRRDSSYSKLLKSLILEGLQYIDSQEVILEVSKNDAGVIEEVIEEAAKETNRIFKIKNKALDCVGGLILSNPEQSVIIDNTFEARLKRFRPLLRSKLNRILFMGG